MIQRKQSLFLLLAFIATVVCLCLPIAEITPMGMGGSIKLYNLCIITSAGANYSVCGLFGILAMSATLNRNNIPLQQPKATEQVLRMQPILTHSMVHRTGSDSTQHIAC